MKTTMKLLGLAVLLPVLSGCFVIKVNLAPEAQPLEEQVISSDGKDKIVLMDISGVITSEEGSSVLGSGR